MTESRRYVVRSRLGGTVINHGTKTIGPPYMNSGERHIEVTRYIFQRNETSVLVGIDRHQRVYLIGGFTDYSMKAEKWQRDGRYHQYPAPKFIGHLQEII